MQNAKKLKQLYRDPVILAALLIAIVFWSILSYFIPITKNILWPISTPMLFIVPVFIYPVLEELVFRGLILEYLQKKNSNILFYNITKANFITSILFTSLHFYYHPPLWAAAVFIPSLVFGYAKERYSHLLPAIFLHVFFNFGYIILFTN